jgi:hypothetical protein
MTDWFAPDHKPEPGEQKPAAESVLWVLTKGPNRASAVTRLVPGVGVELRFLWNDDTRATQVDKNTDDLAVAAKTKREELITAGWVDAPPYWSMGPMS